MIVVITGTSGPFQRLIDAAVDYARAESIPLWIQYGEAQLPEGVAGQATVSREEILTKIEEADVVLCHGGSGTILDIRRSGRVPVVMPRKAALGEHINDHQLELAQELEKAGAAICAPAGADLVAAIARAKKAGRIEPDPAAGNALRSAVRDDVMQLTTRPRRFAAGLMRRLTRPPESRIS